MRKIGKKKLLVAGAAVAIVATGGGVALAYWSTSGSGSGTATTADGAANLSVVADWNPAGIAPGAAPQALGATVTNNQTNPVKVNSVTVSIKDITKGGVVATGCTTDDFTITNGGVLTNSESSELAASANRDYTGATIAFNDKSNANQDGCKGVSLDLTYTVNSN